MVQAIDASGSLDAEVREGSPGRPPVLDPEVVARKVITEPATASAVAALIDLMAVLHQRRILHQQGAPARTLLLYLAREGQLRPGDLAVRMNLDQSTISRHLAQLGSAGLVQREPDPGDRRACVLSVTEAGRAAAEQAVAARIAEVAGILEGWPEPDRLEFARLLAQFTGDFAHSDKPAARKGQP